VRFAATAFLCLLLLTAGAARSRTPAAPPAVEQADPALPRLTGGSERNQRPGVAVHLQAQRANPGRVFAQGNPARPMVALTFDDGPDAVYTPQVLDILKAAGVHATFFFTGHRVETYPDVARRTVREGNEIGNHSYDHPNLTRVSAAEVASQLRRTDAIIRQWAGVEPRLFRPPYGKYNDTVLQVAKDLGYQVILWSTDSLDWESLTADQIVRNAAPGIAPGGIILMHSASGGPQEVLTGTIRALPRIIRNARNQGLRLVTVSEMLAPVRS